MSINLKQGNEQQNVCSNYLSMDLRPCLLYTSPSPRDELLTKTGIFGKAIDICKDLEKNERVLSSGIFIGNPFTDVPDLCSNVVVTHTGSHSWAYNEIKKIAKYMWENREKFVAELTPINEAIKLAKASEGLTIFSDAADAPSSGASGDSNINIEELH